MVKLSSIKLDLSDTAEVEYAEGIKVNLRRMPNPDFDAFMSKLRKPQLHRIRKGKMSDDETSNLIKNAMASTVVTGWSGLEDDSGVEIKFSSDKCFEFFKDPELYDFYQFCRTEAADVDNFMRADENDAVGN